MAARKVAVRKTAAPGKRVAKTRPAVARATKRPGGTRTSGKRPAGKRTDASRAVRAAAHARARKPPLASGAPEIMVALNNEHRHIASLLEALADQADMLLPGRSPDFGLMLDIARYMSDYPDEYHHPREDLLFARLSERDPDARAAIAQLLEGHKEIYRRSRELLSELQRAERGGQALDNRRLKYLCDRYIGYYWEHINTEEGKVFPRATAKLRQDDWYAVNSEARLVDDPLFGTRVRKEYQRLSLYLTARVTRATEDIAVAELFGIEALIEAVATVGGAIGEIRGIVRRRLRDSARDSFRSGDSNTARKRSLAAVPAAMLESLREHTGGAAREIRAVVSRSRGELAEPFAARMQYLRRMLD